MSSDAPVESAAATGMGAGTPRIEDAALLRGEARFLDDIPVAMPLHACFVRSPMRTPASCRSTCPPRGPCRAWRRAYAAADLYGELTEWRMPLGFALADLPANTTPFVLASSEVAFAGEAVAVVLADSRRQAEDAAAAARVDYGLWRPWPIAAPRSTKDRRACAASWNRTCCSATRWSTGLRGRVRRSGLGVRRALLDASRRGASDGRARRAGGAGRAATR
ncbi:hypothetical protein WJ968_04635 [Achromobacter xylosoxidans]